MVLTFLRRAAALALLAPAAAFAQPGAPPAAGQAPRTRPPAAGAAAEQGGFKTYEEKLSYVLGVNTARQMLRDNVKPEPQSFTRGFVDGFGDKSLLNDQEMEEVLNEFRRRLNAEAEAAQKKLTDDWKVAFAADKKPKGEPKATKSGLKYEVYAEGKGSKPKETDGVVVHYSGTFPDGKPFDSSLSRGQPATFPLNQVIAGWTEGLQLMSPGSKYKFYVPYALAYGDDGHPPVIPPKQDLVFEVELLQVLPPQGEAPDQTNTPAPE